MKYFYSISTQGFYLDNGMLDAYKAAGSLPADLQEISEADYLAFLILLMDSRAYLTRTAHAFRDCQNWTRWR
jgi:hypothetical protein